MILRRQNGIASLVGVTLTAFLLLIFTVSIATFMNGELQRATDTADNTKAYFNAQSAAEQAVLAIKNDVKTNTPLANFDQGCGSDPIGATYGTTIPGIICRQVLTHASEVSDNIRNNSAVQFDLTNAPSQPNLNVDRVILKWDMRVPPTGGDGSFLNPKDLGSLSQPEASWPVGAPPVMELTATNYFPGQQSTIDDTSSGSVFLVPEWNCPSGCLTSFDFQQANKTKAGLQPVQYASCHAVGPGDYRCSADLYNIAPLGFKTVLRLQSRYGDASYDLKAYDYADELIQLPLQNALVDVTASVGQAFSRIQLAVPIRSAAYPGFTALYGDVSLCKSFDVLTDPITGTVGARQTPGDGLCPLFDAYIPPPGPTVTSITPNSGPTAGGTTVTINGSGFNNIGLNVKIGNNVASIISVTSTQIVAVTSATATGAYEVIVSDSNGTSSGGPYYTYVPPLTPCNAPGFSCGLLGQYFPNPNAVGSPQRTILDPALWWPDFVPTLVSIFYPKNPNGDVSHVSAHWTGEIQLNPGSNTICNTSDDSTKIYVNGTLVLSDWGATIAPHQLCGSYTNSLGYPWWFPIEVYYQNNCCAGSPNGGGAEMELYSGTTESNNLGGRLRTP